VRRPGWGRLLERVAELPQLHAADLVACVSHEVAEAVRSRGVSYDRIIVTPCGVDTARFTPAVSGARIRERFDIGDRFVVGWLGSFRRFHGVELLLECFAEFERLRPEAALLLVGDGLDLPRLRRVAVERRLRNVFFTGNAPYAEMPEYVAALDVGVVLDPGANGFHYSPLKLREYMAAGLAVVAPRSGEISRTLHDGEEAILIEPGSRDALLQALLRVHDDDSLRRRLGRAAREHVTRSGTWSQAIERTDAALSLIA
jgi:glycosyltransferase involved in cell wall biosynthesis